MQAEDQARLAGYNAKRWCCTLLRTLDCGGGQRLWYGAFFGHENQHCPPSLSDYGKLWFPKKSDLHIVAQGSQQDPPSTFDAIAYIGAALVYLFPTNQIVSFDEYASCVFLAHITRQLEACTRVDVVWDRYFSDSIKAAMRKKQGIRMKVAGKNKIPGKAVQKGSELRSKSEPDGYASN